MSGRWRLREPFCGLSHLAGVVLSVAALFALLSLAGGKPRHMAAFSIYGASLIVLYTASTLYHSLPVGPRRVEQLRALDHAAIYGLIAGTYTPICMIALKGAWGWSLLAVVWGIGLVSAVVRLTWYGFPDWLSLTLYVAMGWICVVAPMPFFQALSAGGVGWLVFGGLFYMVGMIVLILDRPRLWPGRFGSHDLWHLFVLGGSACHFVVIHRFVAGAP
jgi:hemolysin III